MEVSVDGFVIDVVRGDVLVEIQTKSFSSIKRKLTQLTATHKVVLVHPIASEKWIVRLTTKRDGTEVRQRRRSPKRGRPDDIFRELVSIPRLFQSQNFALHVVLIREEEVRLHDKKRAWRRKGWVTHERHLLEVVEHHLYESASDMAKFLPADLPQDFTTAELVVPGRPRWLAQKMAYCLREMGVIEAIGKRGNAIMYRRAERELAAAS